MLAGQAGSVVNHHVYGFNWTAFMAQLSAAAAYNITYAGYVSDYSRYLPRNTPRGKIIAYAYAGAATPAIWLIALGAWLAVRLGATDGLVGPARLARQGWAGRGWVRPPLGADELLV